MLKGLSKACKAVNKGKSDQSKIVSIKQLFNIMSIEFCCTVLIPMLTQAIYNLCFTHPGTQLFSEDISSLIISFLMICLIIYDSCNKARKITDVQDEEK
jgi:hypothetical protein